MAKKSAPAEDIKSPLGIEDLFAPTTPEEIKAERLVKIAQQQITTSMRYKEKRMQEIQKSVDLYEGRTKKALKGRWNVPLPVMSGYVDTLLSKTDDPPKVKYGHQEAADMEVAQQVQAKFDQESTSVSGMWALKDRMEKKLASFCGVGLSKVYAFNDEKGEYVSGYDVVDYLDFECEPLGGQILANHTFKGQRNIFKTQSQLTRGATGSKPFYSKKQVLKLIANAGGGRLQKEFQRLYQEKTDRLRALGFNVEQGSYVGISIYNMVEWYMEDPDTGEKWYLFFEPHTGIWIRSCPLKEVFESDTDPFEAWHTHPDPFNFWSKAPADDMRPIAESMNVIFNQSLDARDRKIYRQRAYDPEVFTDPSQLEWRQDGLVETAPGASRVQSIGSGIYELSIPDVDEASTINLMKFMDDLTGLKTGVTASAQGAGEDKKVGIYFGNLQQVADRLGLYNKSYSEAWGRKGLKFQWGLEEHITSAGMMVRMIGEGGYNWVKLTKEKLKSRVRDFDITIVGGQAEVAADEVLKKTKSDALALIVANPNLSVKLNPEVTIEETLRNGGWEDDAIKRFLNKQPPGSELIISRAHQCIQQIMGGTIPPIVRGATTLFMQTIIDFATESTDLELDTYRELMAFATAHQPVVLENAMRQVRLQMASQPQPEQVSGAGGAMPSSGSPTPPPVLAPGSPAPDIAVSEAPLTPSSAKEASVPNIG